MGIRGKGKDVCHGEITELWQTLSKNWVVSSYTQIHWFRWRGSSTVSSSHAPSVAPPNPRMSCREHKWRSDKTYSQSILWKCQQFKPYLCLWLPIPLAASHFSDACLLGQSLQKITGKEIKRLLKKNKRADAEEREDENTFTINSRWMTSLSPAASG